MTDATHKQIIMKDLTISMPKWYEEKRKEYDETIKRSLLREYFRIEVYSNVVRKVVVDAYNNGGYNEIYGIYDFEKNVFYQVGCDMLLFALSGDADYWHEERPASFGYFTLYTDHVNKYGEYDETYKLVIDSKMNNAPNLSGKDVFDKSFRTVCEILYDFLYFEYKGVRYLIDGDYNVLAKFPKKLDVFKNKYVNDDTKQFILKDGKKWCLYDIEEKKVVMDDIVAVSNTYDCDFRLGNGDIYKYDKESGKFALLSKYDSFCDGLDIVKIYRYGSREMLDEKNSRDLIYVLKDDKGKYYIRQNNKVVNKNCPFDNVYVKKEIYEFDNRIVCMVGDISDIYEGYGKFRFNTLNIEGGTQERLWFDKD